MSEISKRDLHQIMIYEFKLGHTVAVAHSNITKIYGSDSVSKNSLACSFQRFRQGDFDDERVSTRHRKQILTNDKGTKNAAKTELSLPAESVKKSNQQKKKTTSRQSGSSGETEASKKCSPRGAMMVC
ncbi:unnamed protein product [Enterobius vermicularis]|uniref:HTH_48 domain-containing protein n=1 Tax=Enterobius vermicularis TaxID=51028 RepID=A0A0N4VA45_ENTVE|nr:unnamed protein product [Enterobius vermicularis]